MGGTTSNRDDFRPQVIEVVAKRAGYRCSLCPRSTLEPSAIDAMRFIYTGEAAHITAASPGGPRYDPSLTPTQRSSIENAIHLCGHCATRIDKNKGRDFAADMLRDRKANHEERIRAESQGDIEAFARQFNDDFAQNIGRDIRKLRRHSRYVLSRLDDHTIIELAGGGSLQIERAVTPVIAEAIKTGSLAVVGEPGAGKTGAVRTAARLLQDAEHEVVVLAADSLAALSLGVLREELDLNTPFDDLFAHWPGEQFRVLIVDGIDAARSKDASDTLRELVRIASESPDWKVLVSIRKFDLRYSLPLQRLFGGAPVALSWQDPEFGSVRHVSVESLGDDELAQAASLSEDLKCLISGANPELLRLLRVPFNLRLAADLLHGGDEPQSLLLIRTQVELLELFWQARVIRDDNMGDARESVLLAAVENMVSSRALRVDRQSINRDSSAGVPLDSVLRAHILAEWFPEGRSSPERSVLVFAHHILFDYAVSRLKLRGLPETMVSFLESDTDLVIAIRLSIVMRLQYEWIQEPGRRSFWDLAIAIVQSNVIPEVGKTIASSVAVLMGSIALEFEHLFDSLESVQTRPHALVVLNHLRGALLAGIRPLFGEHGFPSCALLARASESSLIEVALTLSSILTVVLENPNQLSPLELSDAGVAARRFLTLAWQD